MPDGGRPGDSKVEITIVGIVARRERAVIATSQDGQAVHLVHMAQITLPSPRTVLDYRTSGTNCIGIGGRTCPYPIQVLGSPTLNTNPLRPIIMKDLAERPNRPNVRFGDPA